MDLTFIDPGFEYMIHGIMAFQTEATTSFWSAPLFQFYPRLDQKYADSLCFSDRKNYIKRVLSAVYDEEKHVIDEKVVLYSRRWKECRPQITAALSEAFHCDCGRLFPDLECRVSLNPIEPRFLKEHAFDIFYLNSDQGAIGEAIHEIIHFVWFHIWNQIFGDSYDEYEAPSLKWIFSEMIVESVMKDPRLSSVNPYFPRENGGCIYPYFFDMRVNGALILDVLDELYRSLNIAEFMKRGYALCLDHEAEIRAHMKRAEEHT